MDISYNKTCLSLQPISRGKMSKGDNVRTSIVVATSIGLTIAVVLSSLLRLQRQRPTVTTTETRKLHDKLVVATRIHGKQAESDFEVDRLRTFLKSAIAYADTIVVAVEVVNVFHPRLLVQVQDVVKEFPGIPIEVIGVTPWGRFTPALNAALSYAADNNFDCILFQSLEITLKEEEFRNLKSYFDPQDDLVVGAALEGHNFRAGKRVLHGCTSPWNTLALWSVEKLSLTGFLSVSEGLIDRSLAGVEEVAVIALLQNISTTATMMKWWRGSSKKPGGGGAARAKLVRLVVDWKADWSDPSRREWHEKKMKSKLNRAQSQLEALNLLNTAYVWHIDAS